VLLSGMRPAPSGGLDGQEAIAHVLGHASGAAVPGIALRATDGDDKMRKLSRLGM